MKVLTYITLLLMLSACAHTPNKTHKLTKEHCITQPVALIVTPSKSLIAKYQKENSEEDYNTIVDDDVYYLSQSEQYLDSVKANKIRVKSVGVIRFKTSAGKTYTMRLDTIFFGVILFNGKDKPISADIVEIQPDYYRYMKK